MGVRRAREVVLLFEGGCLSTSFGTWLRLMLDATVGSWKVLRP